MKQRKKTTKKEPVQPADAAMPWDEFVALFLATPGRPLDAQGAA